MAISKALLLKGIGGVAAVGTVALGSVGIANPDGFGDLFKGQDQIEADKKAKVEEVNGKLSTLGLQDDCRLATENFSSSSSYSKDCVLDQTKFKKIKFSNGDGSAEANVEGWSSDNITLNISNKKGGIKFLFKDVKDDLTINKSASVQEENNITIKKEKETEFEIKSEKLRVRN